MKVKALKQNFEVEIIDIPKENFNHHSYLYAFSPYSLKGSSSFWNLLNNEEDGYQAFYDMDDRLIAASQLFFD